jgi:phosphatidate cytidylyltransferase
MAFNFSVFKVRALSAIVFVLIMLAGLLFNGWSYFTLFLLIQIGCLYEYQKLMRIIFPSYNQISKMHQWGVFVVGILMMTSLAPTDIVLPTSLLNTLPSCRCSSGGKSVNTISRSALRCDSVSVHPSTPNVTD